MTNTPLLSMVPRNVILLREMAEPEKIERAKGAGHLGPDHTNVSLYLSKKVHASMKKRAQSLGISLSKYISQLYKLDPGGNFAIQPEKSKKE